MEIDFFSSAILGVLHVNTEQPSSPAVEGTARAAKTLRRVIRGLVRARRPRRGHRRHCRCVQRARRERGPLHGSALWRAALHSWRRVSVHTFHCCCCVVCLRPRHQRCLLQQPRRHRRVQRGQAVNGRVNGVVKEPDAGTVAYAVKWESAAACTARAV
jgi:hypothetical protein